MNIFKFKYQIFLSILVFSLGLPLFSSVLDILGCCENIDSYISRLHGTIADVRDRIENISYGLGDGSNLTWRDIYGMSQALDSLQYSDAILIDMSSNVGEIRAYANSLENSSFPTNSTDLTPIVIRLDNIISNVNNIAIFVSNIKETLDSFDSWFQDNKDKLTNYLDNWGDFTNSLPSIAFYGYFTNRVTSTSGSQRNQINGFPFYFYNFSSGKFSSSPVFTTSWGHYNPYLNDSNSIDISKIKNLPDLFSLLHFDLTYGFNGIGNNLYTNTVDTISFHRDYQKDFKSYSDFTTNKITEINSIFYNNSPLEDLQADVNPSNIYNFVTNYYIKVSTDPSGSASENKTNWFNRIEMLLTALVFRPSETAPSNNFDNATETQSQAFSDSLKSVLEGDISDIQGNSQNVLQDFEKTKTSLLNFFGHLDDKLSSLASIPSHIEFFEVTTTSGDTKKVQIVTQGAFASLADAFRSITTLCWVSFFVYVIFVLSRWLFVKFSAILKFCYSVFKTLIGLG